MQRMVLGRTGLEVCRLGFGGIPIQRVSEEQAVETVRHAVESGVDFIDTSRAYTTSERRIGLALRQTDKKVVLASKSHSKAADAMRADLEVSLRELQTEHIDIYKCHFVSTEEEYERVTSPGGALEALQAAKAEGLIGHVGITSHNLDVLDRALDDDLFDVLMVCYSFLEPKAGETIIPKAAARNVGVLAMKPFSGGVIEETRLALKFALSVPDVVVLAGVEDPRLFDDNWRVFGEASDLSDEERGEIAAIKATYDRVFCRRCDYCQPCTEEIPIQTVLGIRGLVKRMGTDLVRKGPFGAAMEKARNCTDCGECMTRCPYKLPIPDLIRENIRWLDGLD